MLGLPVVAHKQRQPTVDQVRLTKGIPSKLPLLGSGLSGIRVPAIILRQCPRKTGQERVIHLKEARLHRGLHQQLRQRINWHRLRRQKTLGSVSTVRSLLKIPLSAESIHRNTAHWTTLLF